LNNKSPFKVVGPNQRLINNKNQKDIPITSEI